MHRPKIIIGLLGIDQHEVGAIAVAGLLRDAGMEVIYAGRYNTPASLISMASDEDADIIGISCHSWEYLEYVPELMRMIETEQLDISVVLGGSIITAGDAAAMRQVGVAGIYGPESGPDLMVSELHAFAASRQSRLRDSLRSP